MTYRWARSIAKRLVGLVFLPYLTLLAWLGSSKERVVWTPAPLINNKYWSEAVREGGIESETLMVGVYGINRREDFDLTFDDLVPRWLRPGALRQVVGPYLALARVLRRAKVVHIPFDGGPIGATPYWRSEARLLRRAGVKIVVIPYGADFYRYSQVMDPLLRHALLLGFSRHARTEEAIDARVRYWTREADVIIAGFILDGLGRWDVAPGNMLAIDTRHWAPKETYPTGDGVRGPPVRVLHAPNHRGAKGSEFIVAAVEKLRKEGLQVDLELVEKKPNDHVRARMAEADIYADALVATGYGMAAVEALASGLVVLDNLENEAYTRLFRRYSYLGECPIVSTTPERIEATIRALVRDPALRERLGRAGVEYVRRYHSYEAARFLFTSIYDKLDGKDIDLMNLYHPLLSARFASLPRIDHGLVESRLPEER